MAANKAKVFRDFIDEIIKANTTNQVLDILYRGDGVDIAYQKDLISYEDHERLFALADKIIWQPGF